MKKQKKKKTKKLFKKAPSELEENFEAFVNDHLNESEEEYDEGLGLDEQEVGGQETDEVADEDIVKKKKKKTTSTKSAKPRAGLGDELLQVYESSGDNGATMNTFEHRNKRWQRMLWGILGALVILFIGVALGSWFFYGSSPQFKGENVVLEIISSSEVASGSEIEYEISYGNMETINFADSELELRYPPGFIFTEANPPADSADSLWEFGSIQPGKKDTIKVKGILVGTPDQSLTLSAEFRYSPANFSSPFRELATYETSIIPPEIEFKLDGPDRILVGQEITYSLTYENTSETPAKDLKIAFAFPSGVTVNETVPELADQDLFEFTVDELPSKEEQEIVIKGVFTGGDDDNLAIKAVLSQKGAEDEYFVQLEETYESSVIKGDLVINTIANGSEGDGSLMWGDVVNISIPYENNSETDLGDIEVTVLVESRYRSEEVRDETKGIVDWENIIDSSKASVKDLDKTDGKTLRLRQMKWTNQEIESLDLLKSFDNDSIDFQIPLKSLSKVKEDIVYPEDVELVISAIAIIGKTGEIDDEVEVTSNSITLALNSDLGLDAHVRYFDDQGNPLGSGPLPPEVGEKTNYRIVWKISNSLHEIRDLIVSAELPTNVKWANQYDVSAGQADYDASANSLAWKLNLMPLDVSEVELAFDVTVTPKTAQIDKLADLTKRITMTATDTVTGGKIIQTISPLTTAADRDEKASDKGLVVEASEDEE